MRAGAAPLTPELTRAEELARELDKPMGVLGVLFAFLVLAQSLATAPWLVTSLAVLGWVLWAVFVAEFALRAYVAKEQKRFWARNWWQVLFLALPFLRFARALRTLRLARAGGVLSSAVRGSRSAGRLLSGRITWLGVVTVVVMLASSQLLLVLGAYPDYALALHDAALATMTGEPLSATGGVADIIEIVLAAYSVAVFGTLAGAVGAYFLRKEPAPTSVETASAALSERRRGSRP